MHALTKSATRGRLRELMPVSALPKEEEGIRAVLEVLQSKGRKGPRCRLVGPSGQELEIPESIFHVLSQVAEVLVRGDAVTVVPVGKELTTQQAADLLNVSRQYLVRLLEQGRIPFSKTGRHRRIRMDDLVAFRTIRDRERREALSELTELSEELGLYEELR